jgi:ribosomal-protein-alanine N-acetyltransferase
MFTIIKGEEHHAPVMHAIEAEAFAQPWSELSIKYEIAHKHSICFAAADENGEIHGHAYMRHMINEGHIVNVAVRKNSRRRGIGSMLVAALVEAARARAMVGLTLDVRVSNHSAIALYEKHGFRLEGVRKNYYSHPTENGLVMWRMLNG